MEEKCSMFNQFLLVELTKTGWSDLHMKTSDV